MLIDCGSMIVIGILSVLFGAFFFQKKRSDMLTIGVIILWFVASLMPVPYVGGSMLIHNADINNEDFLVYTGEFEKDHGRELIFLNDEKTTRLSNTNSTFLDTGSYFGRIIYSQRSKYVLSYSLDNGDRASVVDETTDNFQSQP